MRSMWIKNVMLLANSLEKIPEQLVLNYFG